ncbi:MAG: hypothetical protein DYG92_01815 [Leptolyngbya sp. PLA1]|nr:hypothetical protein [Leptolyngbya sp. PLA1]
MRHLGEFFGEVWKGIKADPTSPAPRAVSRTRIEERHVDTPAGQVTLRRTIIEEVVPARKRER